MNMSVGRCGVLQLQRLPRLCHPPVFCQHLRYESNNQLQQPERAMEWSKVIGNAEKVVGYPASYLSLRSLLSDEISNVAFNMRKLVKTNHPLVKTSKRLIYGGRNGLQTRALLVLLVAKAWGVSGDTASGDDEVCDGIRADQRQLAEVTEMIHTASLVHRGVVNVGRERAGGNDMQFGNKMAVLSGDYLLAHASATLAKLGNTDVVRMMATALSDISQAGFATAHDRMGNRVARDSATMEEWERVTFLTSGSLLANSCTAALALGRHGGAPDTLERAYQLGVELACALQLHTELQPYVTGDGEEDGGACLASAPVVAHMCGQRGGAVRAMVRDAAGQHDFSNLRGPVYKAVRSDAEAISRCKRLCRQYAATTAHHLRGFPAHSDATTALTHFVNAIAAD